MRLKAVSRLGWVAVGALALLAALWFGISRTNVVQNAILQTVGRLAGVTIGATSSRFSAGGADLRGVIVRSPRGETIARIDRVALSYNLRDALLPGGKRLFGLSSVTLERPQFTIVHRADGTYDIPLFSPSTTSAGVSAPLIADVRVSDGSAELIDQARVEPAARRLYVDRIEADAHIDTAARSRYTASLDYREDDRRYTIRAAGDADVASGYVLHHVQAAQLPIARLLDYGINSKQARVLSGTLRQLDVRYFGLADPGSAVRPRLAATARLSDMTITASQLSLPIRDVHGRIDAYENGFVSRDLQASLGDIPLRLSGGVYDLQHPVLRAALQGSADAAQLRACRCPGHSPSPSRRRAARNSRRLTCRYARLKSFTTAFPYGNSTRSWRPAAPGQMSSRCKVGTAGFTSTRAGMSAFPARPARLRSWREPTGRRRACRI